MPKDRLLFSKEGRAKYISHLDLMRTFQRAFLRADIPIKHTEGFNPHPFISIALPLSLGFSSKCEILEFGLLPGTDYGDVPARLNAALPEGVTVHSCYPAQRPMRELTWLKYAVTMDISCPSEEFRAAWTECLSREAWVIEKKSKKAKSGVTTVDIIPLVKEYHFTESASSQVTLHVVVAAQNPGLNPSVLVNAFTEEHPELAPSFTAYTRLQTLDSRGEKFI